MALITINGVTVLSGTVHMPLVGIWTADLVLDNPDGTGFSAGTSVTLSTTDGKFTLVGIIDPNRNGALLDASHVRVRGGAGGMAKLVTPRYYAQPGALVQDVVSALLSDVGESLSATADVGFLTTQLPAWLVMQATASASLQRIIDVVSPGFHWRVLTDGTVWVGSESWPAATVDGADAVSFNPIDGSYDLGVESPSIVPGSSVSGVNLSGTSNSDVGNVGRVEHHIEGGKIRTIVYQDIPDIERGIAASIGTMVANEIAHVDLFALYESKVISQSGNNVDVQPKDARLPGMSGIPLRHGLPGVSVQIVPGAFVLVGWDGGDPSKPFACQWNGDATATSIVIGDIANDSITIANGMVTIKAGGVQVLQASATKLALGLLGSIPVLVLGATDAIYGAPILQNPAASATIVDAG